MRFHAIAVDYDGTLATDGRVAKSTLKALRKARDSGRKLLLVTGRLISSLEKVFPENALFDLIVAENGGVLYKPAGKKKKLLGPRANKDLVKQLEKRKIKPLEIGSCIVATCEPREAEVFGIIHELGLEQQVVFNKGAVMILPPGVNKGTGLSIALHEVGISPLNTVAIGDAENDHALLQCAGFGVAVSNAINSLKRRADLVTEETEGAGVEELVGRLIEDDLEGLLGKRGRQNVVIGQIDSGQEVRIDPLTTCLMVTGPSGSGKTSVTTSVLERIAAKGYQFCVIDPEGDYERFPNTIRIGDPDHVPAVDEVIQLLEHFENPVVNLLGLPLQNRPVFFAHLLARIQELRFRTGRPHWLAVDEAHHMIPTQLLSASVTLPVNLEGTLMVTVNPDKVSREALAKVGLLLATGGDAEDTLRQFAKAIEAKMPDVPRARHRKKYELVAWDRRTDSSPFQVRIEPSTVEHDRHERKYARGDLEEEAFIFRGPGGKLRLKAQNLSLFIQIAHGIDDKTWTFHLKRHDYSHWVRKALQDDKLADKIEAIEEKRKLSPRKSREAIADAIEKAYTAAAA